MQKELLPVLRQVEKTQDLSPLMDHLSEAPVEAKIAYKMIMDDASDVHDRCKQVINIGNYGLMRSNGAVVVVDKKTFERHGPWH